MALSPNGMASSPSRHKPFPAHTCCARLLYEHHGDAAQETLSLKSGVLVLVQGERMAAEGWCWCCSEGQNGMLPTNYLKPAGSKSFRARVLFDFEAGDEGELTCSIGAVLQLLPSVSDPEGWCTAMLRRQQGLVPQAYVQPMDEGRWPVDESHESPQPVLPSPRQNTEALQRARDLAAQRSPRASPRAQPQPTKAPASSKPLAHLQSPRASQQNAAALQAARELAAQRSPRAQPQPRAQLQPTTQPAPHPQNAQALQAARELAAQRSPRATAPTTRPRPALQQQEEEQAQLHRQLQLAQQQQSATARAAATVAAGVAMARAELRANFRGGGRGAGGCGCGAPSAAAPPRVGKGSGGQMVQPRGGRLDGAVRAPPRDFEPEEAMRLIFELGLSIAEARRGEDTERSYSQFRLLKAQLRIWSLWEEARPKRELAAAVIVQAALRGLLARSRCRLALGETRQRRQNANAAATSIQAQKRAAQARELVARRRAAISIQRVLRGQRSRRACGAARTRPAQKGGLLRKLSFGRLRGKKGDKRLESPTIARQGSPARRGSRGRSLSFDKWQTPSRGGGGRSGGGGLAGPAGLTGLGGGLGGDGGSGGGGGGRGGGRGSNLRPPLNARPPTQSFEEQLRRGPLMSGLQPSERREPELQRATSFGNRMPARSLPQSEKLGRRDERRTSLDADGVSPAGLDFAGGVDLRRASELMDFSPRRRSDEKKNVY